MVLERAPCKMVIISNPHKNTKTEGKMVAHSVSWACPTGSLQGVNSQVQFTCHSSYHFPAGALEVPRLPLLPPA